MPGDLEGYEADSTVAAVERNTGEHLHGAEHKCSCNQSVFLYPAF